MSNEKVLFPVVKPGETFEVAGVQRLPASATRAA